MGLSAVKTLHCQTATGKFLKSFTTVGCPVIYAPLAIPRVAVSALGIGFGIALDFTGVRCHCLIHLLLLYFGLDVELSVGSLFVQVLCGQ